MNMRISRVMAAVIFCACGAGKERLDEQREVDSSTAAPKSDSPGGDGKMKGVKSVAPLELKDTKAQAVKAKPLPAQNIDYQPPVVPARRFGPGGWKSTVEAAFRDGWIALENYPVVIGTVSRGADEFVLFREQGLLLFCDEVEKTLGKKALRQVLEVIGQVDKEKIFEDAKKKEIVAPYEKLFYVDHFKSVLESDDVTWTYWFARLTKRETPALADTEQKGSDTTEPAMNISWQRQFAILLTGFGTAIDKNGKWEGGSWEPVARDELKVRDMDGDGELEVKVVFSSGLMKPYNYMTGWDNKKFGTQGYIIDRDGNVQMHLVRESYLAVNLQGAIGYNVTKTTWQLADINGDGHADLKVNRRSNIDVNMWECGEGVEQPDDVKKYQSDENICLYQSAEDRWKCPVFKEFEPWY